MSSNEASAAEEAVQPGAEPHTTSGNANPSPIDDSDQNQQNSEQGTAASTETQPASTETQPASTETQPASAETQPAPAVIESMGELAGVVIPRLPTIKLVTIPSDDAEADD
ncbi:hypothetical protein EV175_006133, partial [Coemansia sp. RSA 1933]